MAKEIVTLYIDDSSIRLLITEGTEIMKWAELPLEPGQVKNAVVIEEAEVAAKITQLLEVQNVKSKKVNVGVSGLYCLSRLLTLPPLPKAMLDEAVKREAKRVLPVPLEQVYLSWQSSTSLEGQQQVFLVAVPHKIADTLIATLRQAGLKPEVLDLKPLLLARLVTEATTLIVNIQPTEFDIVILVDGIPQPIDTVSFRGENLSLQDKLPMIRDEINRTIKFYNSNNQEKPLVPGIPIFTSIALADEVALSQYLSEELGRTILPLSSPIQCPQGLDPNRYMVNIGLAFKTLSIGEEAGHEILNLNMLPTTYMPESLPLTKILVWPSAAVAVGLIIFLVIFSLSASSDITSMRNQLDTMNQHLQERLPLREELRYDIKQAEVSYNNFNTIINSLDTQNNGVNGGLEETVNSLPSTISLKSISDNSSILNIQGRSKNEEELLSYLTKLDTSGRFTKITITQMMKSEIEGIDFSLVLRVGDQS
jgi:type IV pilus assembly protein PilM